MTVRTARLFGPLPNTQGNTLLVTCPVGKTIIVKHMTFATFNAVARKGWLYLGAPSASSCVWEGNVPAESSLDWFPFLVLEPGDPLYWYSGAGYPAGEVNIQGSGVVLDGVAGY